MKPKFEHYVVIVFSFLFVSLAFSETELIVKKDSLNTDKRLVEIEKAELADAQIIKKVNINIHPIFDESNPRENNFLFRLANRLHIGTDEDVIRNDLLFDEGSQVDKDILYESERILRTRRYLNKASVSLKEGECVDAVEASESAALELEPIEIKNATQAVEVDIVETTIEKEEINKGADGCQKSAEVDVDVNEVWTLVPTFGFSRSGGNDEYSVGFQDSNFLGYGKSFTIEYNSSDERSGKLFEYKDPNTGWHQTQLALAYENNSDGSRHFFSFTRPYFSLSTHNSGGVLYDKFVREQSYYNEGDEVSSYENQSEVSSFFYGSKFHFSNELAVHRWNIGYLDENEQFRTILNEGVVIAPPENRVFKIAWGEYQFIQNQFSRFNNIQQINRVEDINLGWQARFRLGYTYSPISKFDESLYFDGEIYRGFNLNKNNLLLFESRFNGFYGDSEIYNGLVQARIDYHGRTSSNSQFYAGLSGAKGLRLFQDRFLYMGGEQRLRGYDDNYQSGDKSYVLNIEQRFYGKKEWLSLFYMGFVIFYDEGRAWGNSAAPQTQDARLRDYGFGLRFSGTRNGSEEEGSHNVLHIDFANPLDGGDDLSNVEISIRVNKSF